MEYQEADAGKNFKSIILVVLIAAMLGLFIYLQGQKTTGQSGPATSLAIGQPAPDFELPLLNGETARLSDYKGKVVFLNIWATWCGPCKEEMPSMEKLHQQMKGQDFEILAVSIDTNGADAVAPFTKKHNLTFPILLDKSGQTSRLYRTTGVPETFIIDKEGRLRAKVIGYRDWSTPDVVQQLKDLAQGPKEG